MSDYLKYGFRMKESGDPQCLICLKVFSVATKHPSKMKRHYERKHPESQNLPGEVFQNKVRELEVLEGKERESLSGETTLADSEESQLRQKLCECSYAAALAIARADKWPRTASGLPSTAGTTASIAFIRKGKIYIGHVGDSGIILGYQEEGDPQWKAKALTKDHKPESGPEMTRIQESGGKVVSKSGVPRVVWNRPRIGHKGPVRRSTHIDEIPFLAVARALGDLWSYNSELDTFVVSPEPDVKVVTIDVKTHRCLIFGTDGLWNMLTPQAAVAIVQAAERHNEKHLIAAQRNGGGQSDVHMWINPSTSLVDRALERWSSTRLRADNTSVVTLMLDPPGPSRSEIFQNQKREHVASPKTSVRPVFYPTTPVNPGDDARKPDAKPEIPDPMKSPLKTCLCCGSAEKAVCVDQTPLMKETPQNTPKAKSLLNPEDSPLTSKSIQVAEISSSDISEESKESRELLQNPLEPLKPIQDADISLASDLPPMNSISNLVSLIEKVPKPERFPIEAKVPKAYSDEEVEKLFSMSRQNAFYGTEFQSQEGLRTKRVSNLNSTTEGEERFQGSSRHNALRENPKGITGQFSQRLKRSSNLECVVEEIDKLHSLTRQNSFCEKSKGIPGQFGSRQKKSSALDSTTDDVKADVQYARPIIISESKRKQSLILHPEKPNLYTNENLKKTSRRHSIGALPRNTLTPKSNLKEPSVPYLRCKIKRDSKSLPGNVFEEPRIADSTAPRINNALRGVKRRHSSITHANDGACITGETCPKRRTRSEDRPNLMDENDPANEKLAAEEVHNRLRWPANDSTLSRSGAVLNSSAAGIQERKLSSPNSFQRRNLEKKVTPVKTIRRPSINGSNRIQLRGIFGLRDWDQGRSNRNVGCPSRHRTVVGLINSVSEPAIPQRWLRSDTIAATPVKTLRSRNVDIAGHTVSAQVAHQYPIKQSRLPVPAKLKATSTSVLASQPSKNKISCSSTSSSMGKARQSRCNAANAVSESCSNVISIAGISNESTVTRRVKSPHSLASRVSSVSPLSTRSRIKRLGK